MGREPRVGFICYIADLLGHPRKVMHPPQMWKGQLLPATPYSGIRLPGTEGVTTAQLDLQVLRGAQMLPREVSP